MENYLPRLIDGKLDQLLKISGAVEICGPKWSGKTTSAMQKAASSLFLDDGLIASQWEKPILQCCSMALIHV